MISETGVKMNLRIITKNHAADPEIEFLTESILKPYDLAAAMPTAWELIKIDEERKFSVCLLQFVTI